MWKEHSVILNEDNQIVYIGDKALKFADRSGKRVFAYPEGKVEKGDLLVYFEKHASDVKGDMFAPFFTESTVYSTDSSEDEYFVMICEAGNEAVAPVIKQAEMAEQGVHVLLDTIYNGTEVVVKQEKNMLLVEVNGQFLCFRLDDMTRCAVLKDDFGIKYFESDRDNDYGNLKRIFEEGVFNAMADKKYMYGKSLDEIFYPAAAAAFSELNNEKNETLVNLRGKAVRIIAEKVESLDGTINVYLCEDEEILIDTVREKTDAYERMSDSPELNSMHKQQVTMFRLFGSHEKMKETERLLQKGSITNTTILLTGESGTGKTFLANEIHKNSKRSSGPFVHVNCAAIPYQLIESELFGYEDGAFTGARKGGKKGYFELSSGGTLFLDEITEIPVSLQGKLLEVLQNRTFYRVGGTKKLETNIRVIAATNRDLRKEIEEKRFREDLYYRINVFPVEIPPLRERTESIYEIISDILPEICSRLEIEPLVVSSQALEKMEKYSWPGNIRELENVLEKAAILSDGRMILPDDVLLTEQPAAPIIGKTLKDIKENCEREAIVSALIRFNGDKEKAASELGIGRTNMFDKIKKYNILSREWENK